MELVVKHFSELSAAELADIYELRVAVFVVEQRCPYQEVDRADREAYHVWLRSQAGIEAYLRVLPRGVNFPDVSIGRVIAVRRRQGLGSRILAEGMRVARERLDQNNKSQRGGTPAPLYGEIETPSTVTLPRPAAVPAPAHT